MLIGCLFNFLFPRYFLVSDFALSGVARILSQEGHGVHVHEIKPKSHKFLHINKKKTGKLNRLGI